MAEPNTAPQGIDFLDTALKVSGQLAANLTAWGQLVPLADFAIRKLYELFKRDNPQLTPEQFFQYLKTQGGLVKAFSKDWLEAHGYTLDPVSGEWQAPPQPAPLPVPASVTTAARPPAIQPSNVSA